MLLSSISLALTRLGQRLGRWSPLALWPTGTEPGMWISPSLLTASFNDSTGTTPVSTPGTVADSANPVGLALDIRGGLAAGAVVFTENFASAGLWSLGTGATISGGSLNLSSTPNQTGAFLLNPPGMSAGKYYEITFEITSISSGAVSVSYGYSPGLSNPKTSAGIYTVQCFSADTYIRVYAVGTTTTAVIDNISIREIPGNHMFQSTSTARPLESARVNKFVGTELYTNNAVNSNGWSGTVGAGTVTPNAMFVGSVALSQVTISASTGTKGAYNADSPAFPFVVSGFAKADGYRYLQIYGAGTGSFGGLVFDAVAGVFSQNTNSLETSVTASGGGAFRFSVKSPGGVDSIGFGIIPQDTVTTDYGNQSWAGDGVSGMYLGGFSLVYGDQYTPYQSVPGDGSTYNATGITPFQLYDGVDDGMATASFAAGTLINGMDCMIAVRRDSGAETIAGLYESSAGSKWLGRANNSGDSSDCVKGAGNPTVFVDNVQLPARTVSALNDALTVGEFHILEFRGLDLSVWTVAQFGNFAYGYQFKGARGDIMLFPSTASTTDKDAARQWLADYYGVTLP